MRIGNGFDFHCLVENRKLIIGGVDIPNDKGLAGHSDADVLVHAVMDALLGAAGLCDIGTYFPPSDNTYKDIDSLFLLEKVGGLLAEKGYEIINIDTVIVAEKPKMMPHIAAMKQNIGRALSIGDDLIGIKASTTEGAGATGRGEGIAAYAAVLIEMKK